MTVFTQKGLKKVDKFLTDIKEKYPEKNKKEMPNLASILFNIPEHLDSDKNYEDEWFGEKLNLENNTDFILHHA